MIERLEGDGATPAITERHGKVGWIGWKEWEVVVDGVVTKAYEACAVQGWADVWIDGRLVRVYGDIVIRPKTC